MSSNPQQPPSNDPPRTRLQDPGAAEASATRLQGDGPGDPSPPRTRTNLPPELTERLEPVRDLSTHGGQADLLLVRDRSAGGRISVLKYYRFGTIPHEVLASLSAADRDHVVEIYDFSPPESPHAWELLEYCEHGSLRELMSEPGDPAEREALAAAVLAELAPAIEHLASGHQAAHRDVKPENVLVRSSDPLDLVLADFGIARTLAATKNYTSNARSVGYASPEAISGQFSIKSDWWSLGMILAEILLGRHLQSDPDGTLPSEQRLSAEITTTTLELTAITDERWRLILGGLITSNPDHRWSAQEVRAWSAGETPQTNRGQSQQTAATRRRVTPMGFPDPDSGTEAEFRDPAELAAAMAAGWDEAAAILSGSDRRKLAMLRDFLRSCDLEPAERLLADDDDPESKLVRLLVYLDPDIAPTFRGYSLDPDGLTALASNATTNDPAAGALSQIHEGMVLRHYATEEGERSDYASVEGAWRAESQRLDSALAGAPTDRAERDQVAARARAQILSCLLDPGLAAKARERADEAVASTRAREREWFAQLTEQPDATDSLGSSWAIIALEPVAVAEAEAEARREREAAEAVLNGYLEEQSRLTRPAFRRELDEDTFAFGCIAVVVAFFTASIAGLIGGGIGGHALGVAFGILGGLAPFAWAFEEPLSNHFKADRRYRDRREELSRLIASEREKLSRG